MRHAQAIADKEFGRRHREDDHRLEQADQRMKSGATLMGKGLDQISRATSRDDYAEMQEGVALTKEGLARFDSGLAAKRALSEGKAPRKVALEWFKREMNLLPPDPLADQGRFGGVTFHLFVIVLLGITHGIKSN